MLIFCIIANNVILIALLVRSWRRSRKLTARLEHVGEMCIRVSKDNRALQNESVYIRSRSLEASHKLAELRREMEMILGDGLRNNTNLPPLQSMPTPPECRMVKESFTE